MPLLRRVRVLGAKIEATVGTGETITATETAFNAFDNQSIAPEIEYLEREGQGGFSPLPGALGAYGGRVRFMIQLHGGASTPDWASTFLPACGLIETAGVFAPSSAAPTGGSDSSAVRTITIAEYINGVRRELHGCMGNAVFRFASGRPVQVEFDFVGCWGGNTDATLLVVAGDSTAPLRFVSSSMTIGSWTPVISEMTLDLGNMVTLRPDGSTSTGYKSAIITGRRVNGTIDPESTLVATNDAFGIWTGRTEQALSISLGTAGNGCDITASKLQFTDVQPGDREGLSIESIPFQLNRSAAADDEVSIDVLP